MDTDYSPSCVNNLSNSPVGASGEALVVFYDQQSLEDGEQFDVAFSTALAESLVVTPFLTTSALKRMCQADSIEQLDNVLLEWWLALTLYHSQQGRVRAVLPVFCGEVGRGLGGGRGLGLRGCGI